MLFKDVAGKLLEIQTRQFPQLREKSRATKAIQRMKEVKSLFGDLVETKSQKLKRLKYEEKEAIPPQDEPNIDTEKVYLLPEKEPSKPRVVNLKKGLNYELRLLNKEFITESQKNQPIIKRKVDAAKKKPLLIGVLSTTATKDKTRDMPGKILTHRGTANEDGTKYPSVTKILNATMSEDAKAMLDRWKKRMIAQMGDEGFEIYKQELLQNGKHLHAAIHRYLLQEPLNIHENVEPAFSSVYHILKDMSDVKAIESHVVHPQLHYRGYLDCIARYRGKLCLVDWKKSDKQKSSIMSTYDAPLQVASYIGAVNADEEYPFEISRGLIIVCYTNGDKATVHEIKGDLLQLYWKAWMKRLQKYKSKLEDVTTDAEIKLDP